MYSDLVYQRMSPDPVGHFSRQSGKHVMYPEPDQHDCRQSYNKYNMFSDPFQHASRQTDTE